MTKSKTFNRFQHRCAEYAQANRKTITNGMALTLSAIAHFLNARTLSCFPSYETLAAYAEVDRSTIIRNIRRLVATGVVAKWQESVPSGGVKNCYRITFISSDFSSQAGWQNDTRSKDNNIPHKKKPNTLTNDNLTVESTVKDDGKDTVRTSRLAPGLEWMTSYERGKNPFEKIYSSEKSMGCFVPAWSRLDPDIIFECSLSSEDLAELRRSPIERALALVGESGNTITAKALRKRLERVGEGYFVGEVARMWTQWIEGRGNSWRHPAKILLRRLDYVYATLIATARETVVFDPVRLWDYATRKAAA